MKATTLVLLALQASTLSSPASWVSRQGELGVGKRSRNVPLGIPLRTLQESIAQRLFASLLQGFLKGSLKESIR